MNVALENRILKTQVIALAFFQRRSIRPTPKHPLARCLESPDVLADGARALSSLRPGMSTHAGAQMFRKSFRPR